MADIPKDYFTCRHCVILDLSMWSRTQALTDKYDRQLMQHDAYDSTFPINPVLR